jgi:uncharacterized membrane protein
MSSLTDLLHPGVAAGWLLLPSALVLGVLHGLEPGHSKAIMTAFIIAVRGTVAQAALLGLASTVSHTSVVWVVVLIGMHFDSQYDGAVAEPYFQMASAFLIIAIALWMLRRTWCQQLRLGAAVRQHAYHHSQQDTHELAHADEIRRRFASGNVTTGQIVMFGLSGGLIPCSAAIAVLVLCLQVNRDLARRRFGFVFQYRISDHLDRSGNDRRSRNTPTFAPLVGFGRACPTPAVSLQHRHDRPRALCRLAGLDERSDRPLTVLVTPHMRPSPPNTPPAARIHSGLSRVPSIAPIAAAVTNALCHPISAARAIT